MSVKAVRESADRRRTRALTCGFSFEIINIDESMIIHLRFAAKSQAREIECTARRKAHENLLQSDE